MASKSSNKAKFSLNGALTIGTLDGANVEIRNEVGAENFFLFGLTMEQVQHLKISGYNPMDYYHGDPELRDAIDLINGGLFSPGDGSLFRALTDHLIGHDDYLLMADYRAYVDCQAQVDGAFRDPAHWTRMSILNVARLGKFSSDRAIREYADKIWCVQPLNAEST